MLINFVYEDISSLKKYSDLVIQEFGRRGYKIGKQAMSRYEMYFEDKPTEDVEVVFPKKMNLRYFKQCYYNIEEKYDCCGITFEEFEPLFALAKQIMKGE